MMECCAKCLQQELRTENLGMCHENPTDFVKSQWPVRQQVYAGYRVFVALGLCAWLAADVARYPAWTYLVYATNISFVLLAVTALYTAVCTVFYSVTSGMVLDRHTFEKMPASLKLQWRLQNVSYNSAIVVTVSYWAYIALLDRSTDTPDLQTTMSQVKHTVNTVYVVVDIMISATPFRVLHLLYTVILGSLYSLFNAIYFLSDGTMSEGRHYAYNLLDWSHPEEAAVTCVLGVVMCVISQVIMYAVYKIRTLLFIKMYFGSSCEKPGSELEGIMGPINSAEYIAVQNEDSEQSQERNATESCN